MAKQQALSLFQRRRGLHTPPLKLYQAEKDDIEKPVKVRSKFIKLFFLLITDCHPQLKSVSNCLQN